MKKSNDNLDKIVIQFLDASAKDDDDLRLLGNVLKACDYDLFEGESLQAIGFKIIEYLDRKIVKDHYFWKRPLNSYSGSEKDLKMDLYCLKESLKD